MPRLQCGRIAVLCRLRTCHAGFVGTGRIFEDCKAVAMHARRRLSDAEIAGLDPAWLAIEPVDMG